MSDACYSGGSEYAHQLSQKTGQVDMDAGRFVAFGLFSTLTNVNFDPERFRVFLQEAQDLRDRLASHPAAPTLTSPTATFSCSTSDLNRLVTYGKNVSTASLLPPSQPAAVSRTTRHQQIPPPPQS